MIPGVVAHLWQSTWFLGAAWLLTLVLRRNGAQVRFAVWFAGSVKFLIPFSLLVGLGSLAPRHEAEPAARGEWLAAAQRMGQPLVAFPAAAIQVAGATPRAHYMGAAVLILWACGFATVAICWLGRWRRMHTLRHSAKLANLGELAVPVMFAPGLVEPGVLGIFRPVLLLPEGIEERLDAGQLKAILAHELCHVRRRDNLTAAIHMVTHAIFWFHPLVWWVGARLVEERENACDEEVLRSGSRPEVYAESILKTCQFYLESPLVCMSGIAGSDLKKRIVRIMTQRVANKLSLGRKLLLSAAGIAAVAGPIVFGLVNAPQSRAQSQQAAIGTPAPAFDVASIKPDHGGTGLFRIRADAGRFVAENATLKFLLQYAYHVKDSQISGAAGWIDSEHFDIDAKVDDSSGDAQRKLNSDEDGAQLRLMVQSLLADRFKLTLHHETKELPIYVLVVAKNGPKLHESAVTPEDNVPLGPPGPPDGPQPRHSIRMGRGDLSISAESLDMFAEVLSRHVGRLVVNQTGLKGLYDFKLQWTPDEGQGQMMALPGGGPSRDAAPPPDASGPSIFTALQEQLGLKLESQKGPVDTLVIDHVEKPSEN